MIKFIFDESNMSIQKVMVLSHSKAARFKVDITDQPVYLIRIFNSPDSLALLPYARLKYPEQFKIIRTYVFDDISQFTDNDLVLFNDEIADRIITDFDNDGKDCQMLLIHCWAGKSRSPAVAIALSEIFHLQTPEQIVALKKQFLIYNKRVYHTILDVNKAAPIAKVSPSPHLLEGPEMMNKDIRVADDFQFAYAKIAQYTNDSTADSYLNNYKPLLKPIKLFLEHYAKELPKLMRLLDYDKFIITKATFMGEGGEKIVLRVTATIKESNDGELTQPIEVGFGLRLHKGSGETFEEVSEGVENEFTHFKLFRRLNGVAIVFHKLYGIQRIENSEAHFSYIENDPLRESLLQNHIYLVSVGEFVEGLDVSEILERQNYDIGFKTNVIMEAAKTLARAWLLSLKPEPADDTEKLVGSVIADLHDGQVVFSSNRLNHLMRVVMIDFGAIMYVDRVRFTKALISFIKGELNIIDLSYSQKDFEFIINRLLEEVDDTTSLIQPHFLTETEFCHEADQFRSLLVQSRGGL